MLQKQNRQQFPNFGGSNAAELLLIVFHLFEFAIPSFAARNSGNSHSLFTAPLFPMARAASASVTPGWGCWQCQWNGWELPMRGSHDGDLRICQDGLCWDKLCHAVPGHVLAVPCQGQVHQPAVYQVMLWHAKQCSPRPCQAEASQAIQTVPCPIGLC